MDRPSEPVPFQDLLLGQKEMARDQLAAAWQLHVEQVEEQLRKGWKEHLSRVFEERFRALSEGMEDEFQKRLSVKQAEVRAASMAEADKASLAARRSLSEHFNQAARRMDQAETEQSWVSAFLDAIQPYARRAGLFSTLQGKVKLMGLRPEPPEPVELDAALAGIPAFANVHESRDTVVCAATPTELSSGIARMMSAEEGGKVTLVPVFGSENRIVAIGVLEEDGENFDLNAVELICQIAGGSRQKAGPKPVGGLALIAPAESTAVPQPSSEEDERHQRAQRFARVKVAEMRLYRSQAVLDGRANKGIYAALREEIDRARQQYREEFLTEPGLPDYFHREIVRTLANDDASLLGADYPGPLA